MKKVRLVIVLKDEILEDEMWADSPKDAIEELNFQLSFHDPEEVVDFYLEEIKEEVTT